MLTELDKFDRDRWIQKYRDGKAALYPKPGTNQEAMPGWVLAGHRCQKTNAWGKCAEPVHRDRDGNHPKYCCAHRNTTIS